MKKLTTCFAIACLGLASGALADERKSQMDVPPEVPTLGGALDCTGALIVDCGATATGTCGPGGNVDNTYGCTTLSYLGCEEVVYEICVGGDTDLIVDMTYTHSDANDLDLFLLGSCDEIDCLDSSTGTSGAEQVVAAVGAGTYYAVVDGWNSGGGRCDGSGHVVTVSCDEPCLVSVEPKT